MKFKLIPLLLALSAPAFAAHKIEVDLALRSAIVVDVTHGQLLRGKVVLTEGDKIVAVVDEKKLGAYKPRKTVQLKGKYIIPGLWDGHMHFGGGDELVEDNKRLMPLYLAHGITTVRDCAGDMTDTVLQWRDQINAGKLQGPTIFMAGAKLEGYKPLWKGTIEVGTPEEVTRALDGLQGQKVDFIKITENTLKPEIYLEALRQAKARGLRTSTHLPGQVTLQQATEAGLGTVEHITYLLRAATPLEAELTAKVAAGEMTGRAASEQSLASFDEATARASFRKMAAAGTAVVPTLSISRVTAYLDQDDHSKDDYLKYLGPKLIATYDWRVKRAALDSPAQIAYRHANIERAASLLPMLAQEGVSIVAGTDAGWLNSFDYPGQALHDEIGLYVKYGLTPTQALQSAVLAAPRFLGKLDQYGDLAAGKKADLVVLDANPLADISATRKIRAVMTKGQWLDRAKLDSMLNEVQQWAAAQKP